MYQCADVLLQVQVMQAVLAALIQCEYEVQQTGQGAAQWQRVSQ